MGQVTINGKTYTGNNVIVKNGVVKIDGREILKELSKPNNTLEVNVTGDSVNLAASVNTHRE